MKEYSCKSKAYRCLNLSTHKIIESAHVRIDEFAEKTKEERKKKLKDYRRFSYIEPDTLPDTSVNKETSSTEPSIVTELQEVQTKSQGLESHFEAIKPMPTNFEKPKPEVEIQNEDSGIQSKGKELILAKYVRRHHAPNQIIGDKSKGSMTSKLKDTCLLANFEPKSVKDALENESWIEAMNEEIEQIEKYLDLKIKM